MRKEATEDFLCGVFAERCRTDDAFLAWVLGKTRFVSTIGDARLLWEEQMRRPAKAWWRHWWCRVPETGRESETDIFLAFDRRSGSPAFALHVENKLEAPLSTEQANEYALRARHMRDNRWVPYTAFETILIAPSAYLARHAEAAKAFDVIITHEEIGERIAAFAPTLIRQGLKELAR